MTQQTFIAPHLREGVFRTYEPFIKVMVDAWPKETSHTPFIERSSVTFLGYFRNAILSARTFNWKTDVDLVKLRSMTGKYLLRIESDGLLWVRAREKAQPSRAVPQGDPTSPPNSGETWKNVTQDEIRALCLLLHFSRVRGPFFVDGEIGVDLREGLTAEFNVGINFVPESKTTIIT